MGSFGLRCTCLENLVILSILEEWRSLLSDYQFFDKNAFSFLKKHLQIEALVEAKFRACLIVVFKNSFLFLKVNQGQNCAF